MKKLWLCIIIIFLFLALFLMPMAWALPDMIDIEQLQERVDGARYKEDLYLSAPDRLEFLAAPEGSNAKKMYLYYLAKKEALPSENALNWAERIFYEHQLNVHGWQKAVAQIKKSD